MKKGDCVLCKHEIPRSDSTSAHSDQDFHCLSMHFTVTSVSLGTPEASGSQLYDVK